MASLRGVAKLEAALARLASRVAVPATVRVGFFEDARYDDGTPVALVAAIQDFGSSANGIPPRPFFRNMIAAKRGEWPDAIAGLLKANEYDAIRTLGVTGEAIRGQLQQSIRDTNSPPLKPATIRRKGFAKTLIDTGQMINSVASEVIRS